jgi:hypothetical protein
VKTEESLHLLPRVVVKLRAPRSTRSHARLNERDEHRDVLVQRPQSVLDRGELRRAGVVTQDGVGRLGAR